MDASPPSPKDSTPTQSSSNSSEHPKNLLFRPELPLSFELYKQEILRRKRVDAEEHADEIRKRCRTLHGFIEEAWPILEPGTEFRDNWHIKLLCKHLEAVTKGEITRLLANVWPGSMKSLIFSVFWQAWEWGPKRMRSLRYISTSFNEIPVKRDTRRTRDLIASEWYQTLWPEVALIRTAELSFANASTGSREGVPFASLTSQRGDRLIIDDPHSVLLAESDVDRAKTIRKFREGAVNRLNDQEKSAIVIIMQRLHTDDLSGVIESYGLGYTHVVLPMEFEKARRYESDWGSDPRTKEGQLADPRRFPPKTIEKLKQSGDYFWAGQYQQRPAPREGGLFKIPENWSAPAEEGGMVVESGPEGGTTVGGWDLAGSKKKTSPYSVRVKMTQAPNGYLYIRHVDRRRVLPAALNTMIKDVTVDDGLAVRQSIPQDPGQAGKHQVNSFATLLSGFDFTFSPETGDKEFRARPFAAQWGAGMVFLVRGAWNAEYIEELRNFPTGSYKDQVDATSRAYAELVNLCGEPPPPNEGPILVDVEDSREMAMIDAGGDPLIDDPWL